MRASAESYGRRLLVPAYWHVVTGTCYNEVVAQHHPISIRLETPVRTAVARAAGEAGLGVSGFIAQLVRQWAKDERNRRIAQDCRRIAALAQGGLTDDPLEMLRPDDAAAALAYLASHSAGFDE